MNAPSTNASPPTPQPSGADEPAPGRAEEVDDRSAIDHQAVAAVIQALPGCDTSTRDLLMADERVASALGAVLAEHAEEGLTPGRLAVLLHRVDRRPLTPTAINGAQHPVGALLHRVPTARALWRTEHERAKRRPAPAPAPVPDEPRRGSPPPPDLWAALGRTGPPSEQGGRRAS